MDAIEEYEIYKASKLSADQLLNDKLSFKSNRLHNSTGIDIEKRMSSRCAVIISGDNDAVDRVQWCAPGRDVTSSAL